MRIATTLALFLAGMPASASAQTRTGAIEGIVREEGSGRPVEGALVIVVESDRVARTNAAGHYVLTHVPAVAREPAPTLASPTVIVRVQRLGYFREMRELVVLEGDTAHLDFHVRQDVRHEEYVIPFETLVLERTRCYGTCPAYRLAIASNGRVTFQSRNPGDSTHAGDSVPPRVFQALLVRASDAGFFDLPRDIQSDRRMCPDVATDHPTVTVTILTSQTETKVVDYHGCFERSDHSLNPMLERLRAFEAAIDSALGSSRWVRSARR